MCASVVSDFLQPHRLYAASLLYPCGSPGKTTGVGTISFSLDALLFTHFVQEITEGEAGKEIWSSVDSYSSFLLL